MPLRLLLTSLLTAAPCLVAGELSLQLLAKAVFAEIADDPSETRLLYEQSLAADPDSYYLVAKAAHWQLRDGNLAASATTQRRYLAEHPRDLAAQLDYADFLLHQMPGDDLAQDMAQKTLEDADANFPQARAVFSRLINLYENRGKREKSLALFEEKLATKSDDASYWLALAPIARTLLPADSGAYTESLQKIFGSIPKSSLTTPFLARKVSEYYRSQNNLPQAITALEAHLDLSPSSHSLRTRLGLLHLSAGDEALGKEILLKVLAIDADQTLAHRSLAKLYQRKNDPEAALHHRAEVLRITGGSAEAAIEISKAYLDLEQPHPARLLLEKSRFHHPEDVAILSQLAVATLQDGLTGRAARLFRQAEQLARSSEDPAMARFLDADFQLAFGDSLWESGDSAAAETRYRQAAQGLDLDQEPTKYARAITALAKLWLDQDKNVAPARALLQRALALDPTNQEAATLLESNK